MTVKVEGTNLVITIPMNTSPKASASGKSLVLATTGGNKVTDLEIAGKKVVVGLNVYVPAN